MDKIPTITISGTFDLKDLAEIMRKYKEGSLKINEAIWELFSRMR